MKDSDDGWQVCLALYTSSSRRSPEARFFALQVIDAALPKLGQEQLQYVRDQLFSFVKSSLAAPSDNLGASFLKNKLAQTLAFVFILTYQHIWPSFFNDFLELLGSPESHIGNSAAVDMYLRVLQVVHEEIGDNLIMREQAVTKRNNTIKDLVRERDISKLTDSWLSILEYYPNTQEIMEGTLKVIGGWVSWIDITLIVNPRYLTLIFNCLQVESLRLTACDTLVEIIAKKMKPGDKMELIRLLDLNNIISQLSSNSDEEFDERVAKLSNFVAMELVHILDGSTSLAANVPLQEGQAAQAEEMLNNFIPTIIQFLANEYDDTSSQVFSSLMEYLGFVRKESKQEKAKVDTSTLQRNAAKQIINFPADSNFISSQRRAILQQLLPKIIMKMKYDEDTPWTGGEDESESEFLEIRSRLKVLQDSIASIDMDLYIDGIVEVVVNSLDPSKVSSWRDVELGLYELSAYSESLKNSAINVVKGIETRASRTLYELFFKMVDSNVVQMDSPSVQLHYIELVNRHCSFFNTNNSAALAKVLDIFVSSLGVHNPNRRVQVRSWYLFFRFVKSVRNLVGDIAKNVFTSLQSLLEIKAVLPAQEDSSEISADAAAEAGSFDSQLYLFELCGLLFSSSADNVSLVQDLLQPIFSDVERSLQNGAADTLTSLQVHHDLMALGTFARGYNDTGYGAAANSDEINTKPLDPVVFSVFKTATQVVITALERMGKFEVIRDAARFSIARLIPVLGMEILPEVTRLISYFLEQCKIDELMDFLGFLGHLVHKFRTQVGVYEMFDSLMTPLFGRISQALNEGDAVAVGGSTDAVILKKNLRRAYLQFIFNVLNNQMGALFFSETNGSIYEPILQSVLTFAKEIDVDDQSSKLAILTLNKMLQVWGTGQVKSDAFNAGASVPGFEPFTYEHVSRLCWEIPALPSFNPKDAQHRLFLGDIALLQHTIYETRGDVYLQYLQESYFPSIGLPADYTSEYIKNLAASQDVKKFKSFFVQFISSISNR